MELFNGKQADYHLFENAIRHWDGYWFGKYECYGDTFPHYWSTLSGDVFASYAQITGDKSYEHKAKASLRGCLNLFFYRWHGILRDGLSRYSKWQKGTLL